MITNQAYLFLIFTINGIVIGLLFDFFRILRKSFKTKDFVTYLEDIIFWILTGTILLYSIFIFNNGEIRLYMFLGIFLGISFYMLLISNYVIKINVAIILFIKKIIKQIIHIFIIPLRFIKKIFVKIFFKPISFITINIRKSAKKFENNIRNIKIGKNKIKNLK